MRWNDGVQKLPRRLWLAITAALFVALLVVHGRHDGSVAWLMWLLAPVYALYVTAVVLLLVTAIAKLRALETPSLPLLRAPWRSHPRSTWILGGFVVAVTLLREGAFDPMVVDFDLYSAEHRVQTQRTANVSSQSWGEGPPETMAGKPVHCSLSCSSRSETCAMVLDRIRCDDDRENLSFENTPFVTVGGMLRIEDPDCYVPLVKEHLISFSGDLSANLATNRVQRSMSVSLRGDLDQRAVGPMSCRNFRRMAAATIAEQVAQNLQAALSSH